MVQLGTVESQETAKERVWRQGETSFYVLGVKWCSWTRSGPEWASRAAAVDAGWGDVARPGWPRARLGDEVAAREEAKWQRRGGPALKRRRGRWLRVRGGVRLG